MNEKQAMTVQKKGQDGIKAVIAKYGDQMWRARATYLPDAQRAAYFERAIFAIANNDLLKPLTQTPSGLLSIYQQLQKAVELGLNIGGTRPHAYIVGYGNKAQLIPTSDGYKFAVTAGPHALFKDVLFGTVCKNDKNFEIDEANGHVANPINPVADRGALVGIWVKMLPRKTGDAPVVRYVPLSKIHNIRDQHSVSWKSKNRASSPWATDGEEMAIKTALKIALKPYIGQCEGLANLMSAEEAEFEEYNSQSVADRMDSRLDDIDITPDDNVVSEQAAEPEKAPEKAPKTAAENEAPEGALF